MNKLNLVANLTLSVLTAVSLGSYAFAEQAPIPDTMLSRQASHVMTGEVMSKSERPSTDRYKDRLDGELVLRVTVVVQGDGVSTDDKVLIKYRRRLDPDNGVKVPVGTLMGHWGVPAVGQEVKVFAKGGKNTGFEALVPNGFQSIKK